MSAVKKRKYVKSGKYGIGGSHYRGKKSTKHKGIRTTYSNAIYTLTKNLSTFVDDVEEYIAVSDSVINNLSDSDLIYKYLFDNYATFRYKISLIPATNDNRQKYYDMYNIWSVLEDITLITKRVKIFSYSIKHPKNKFSKNIRVNVYIYEDGNIDVKLSYISETGKEVPMKFISFNPKTSTYDESYVVDRNSRLNMYYEVLLPNDKFESGILDELKNIEIDNIDDTVWIYSMIVKHSNMSKNFNLLLCKFCEISEVHRNSGGQFQDTYIRLEKCYDVSAGNKISQNYNAYIESNPGRSSTLEFLQYVSGYIEIFRGLPVTDNFYKTYLSPNKIVLSQTTISNFSNIISSIRQGITSTNFLDKNYAPIRNNQFYIIDISNGYHLCNVTIVQYGTTKYSKYNFFIRLAGSGLTRYTGNPKYGSNLDSSNVYNFVALIRSSSGDIYDTLSKSFNGESNNNFFKMFELRLVYHVSSSVSKHDIIPGLSKLTPMESIGPLAVDTNGMITNYINSIELLSPIYVFENTSGSKLVLTDFKSFYVIDQENSIQVRLSKIEDDYYQMIFSDGRLFIHGYDFTTEDTSYVGKVSDIIDISNSSNGIFDSTFLLSGQNRIDKEIPNSATLSSLEDYKQRYNLLSISALSTNEYVLESINISSLYNPNAMIYIEINSPGLVYYDKYSTVVYYDNSMQDILKMMGQCNNLNLKYTITNNLSNLDISVYDVVFAASVNYRDIIFEYSNIYSIVVNFHLYNYRKSNVLNWTLEYSTKNLPEYIDRVLSSIKPDIIDFEINISDINILTHPNIDMPDLSYVIMKIFPEFQTNDIAIGNNFIAKNYSHDIIKHESIERPSNNEIDGIYLSGYITNFLLSDNLYDRVLSCVKEYLDSLDIDSSKLILSIESILSKDGLDLDLVSVLNYMKINLNIISKNGLVNIVKRSNRYSNYSNNIYIYYDGKYSLCSIISEVQYIHHCRNCIETDIFTGSQSILSIGNIFDESKYNELLARTEGYIDDRENNLLISIDNIIKEKLLSIGKIRSKISTLDYIDAQKYSRSIMDTQVNMIYIILNQSVTFTSYSTNTQTNITMMPNSVIMISNGTLEHMSVDIYEPDSIIISYKFS